MNLSKKSLLRHTEGEKKLGFWRSWKFNLGRAVWEKNVKNAVSSFTTIIEDSRAQNSHHLELLGQTDTKKVKSGFLMQFPVTTDDKWFGFYLAKMTANLLGVVGTYPQQAEWVCVCQGAGNIPGKVLCHHEVGEENLLFSELPWVFVGACSDILCSSVCWAALGACGRGVFWV